ncbi:MAG: hypothetical protein K6F73_06565 [Lachnospiraceae bacterium]|nr:hypothetical protein [Lachnospiraceae bacterium]
MENKRQLLFRIAAIVIIVAIAAVMFIIGRGHTIYFDNKTAEYDGKKYESFYKVAIIKDKEKVAKLAEDERGMTDLIGQTLSVTLEITDEKGADPHSAKVSMPIPYGIDGIVINIPELMAGLPADAYMSEFVPVATSEDEEEEEVVIDEFEMTDDM